MRQGKVRGGGQIIEIARPWQPDPNAEAQAVPQPIEDPAQHRLVQS
jgi:hypothetical protein